MRCGNCGSKQISLINKSTYSMGKGILGAAVLGPVGAVAGINGKQSMKYHCMACGQDALDVMASYREQEIDDALSRGDTERLNMLRRNWKNIEFPYSGDNTSRAKDNKDQAWTLDVSAITSRGGVATLPDGTELTPTAATLIILKNRILDILDRKVLSMSVQDIIAYDPELTAQRTSALLRSMVEDGKVKKTIEANTPKFEIISGYTKYEEPVITYPDEEISDNGADDLPNMLECNTELTLEAVAIEEGLGGDFHSLSTSEQNRLYEIIIYKMIESNPNMTLAQLQASNIELKEISSQKLKALLRRMIDNGKVSLTGSGEGSTYSI